jgi:hypothetical protein
LLAECVRQKLLIRSISIHSIGVAYISHRLAWFTCLCNTYANFFLINGDFFKTVYTRARKELDFCIALYILSLYKQKAITNFAREAIAAYKSRHMVD